MLVPSSAGGQRFPGLRWDWGAIGRHFGRVGGEHSAGSGGATGECLALGLYIMVNKRNHPKMAQDFRLVNYFNLPSKLSLWFFVSGWKYLKYLIYIYILSANVYKHVFIIHIHVHMFEAMYTHECSLYSNIVSLCFMFEPFWYILEGRLEKKNKHGNLVNGNQNLGHEHVYFLGADLSFRF